MQPSNSHSPNDHDASLEESALAESRREAAALREQLNAARTELAVARRSLQSRFEEIARLTTLLLEKPKEAGKTKADTALQEAIKSLNGKLKKRDQEIEALKTRVNKFKQSLSWKVTWPIRALGRPLHGQNKASAN